MSERANQPPIHWKRRFFTIWVGSKPRLPVACWPALPWSGG